MSNETPSGLSGADPTPHPKIREYVLNLLAGRDYEPPNEAGYVVSSPVGGGYVKVPSPSPWREGKPQRPFRWWHHLSWSIGFSAGWAAQREKIARDLLAVSGD